MTFGQLMDIVQVLIPTGLIGYIWQWIRTRENRKVLAAKEKNDIYKVMYDNISDTLIELQNENKRLYRAVRQLNQTIQKATGCPHYATCPLRDELQKSEGIDPNPKVRQHTKHKKIRNDPDAHTVQHRPSDNTGASIDNASPGSGI